MDDKVLIDKETFEIYIDHPKLFSCDKGISEAVAIFNKKGYITVASCSGHYKTQFIEGNIADIDFLEELKNDPQIIIRKINKKNIEYASEIFIDQIYVSFNKEYKFDNLPEGFYLDDINKDFPNSVIRHDIKFYDENNIRRSRSDVENEREKYCNILKEWVNNLPYYEKNQIDS